ncbi:uncharacterized protein LOC116415798 [Nasonia vitripennis]|uniref:CCHC-type domain-containing protein n=1 Tax=Nasonia vitripennis TaxID=7425 RepID=A0A7M7PWS8_NASVI|nr:uncharacterized protein LOC116415798 [Nasonia vitripennis]
MTTEKMDSDADAHSEIDFGAKRKLNEIDENIDRREYKKQTINEIETGEKTFDKDGYSENCKGPYQVWIKNLSPSNKFFNIYKVGKIVVKYYKTVQEVKKDGRFRGIIVFNDREEANKALEDTIFKDNDMTTFVPGFKKMRKGVLRGIPIDLSTDDLKTEIMSSLEVINVSRMNRKNPNSTNDDDKWIPTTSVMVTFKGDFLSKEVSICLVKTKVDPYVRRPMQCYNCFKFGHMAKTCRNQKRCSMCGELHHDEGCSGVTPRCANCKGSHKSIDSRCQIYEKNKLLCERMAYDNLSYAEAHARIFGKSNAPRLNRLDFPNLRNRTNKEPEVFNNQTQLQDGNQNASQIQPKDNMGQNILSPTITTKSTSTTMPVRNYSRMNAQQFFYTNNNTNTNSQTSTQLKGEKEKDKPANLPSTNQPLRNSLQTSQTTLSRMSTTKKLHARLSNSTNNLKPLNKKSSSQNQKT